MHDNACVNEVDATSAFANAFAQPTDTISYPISFVEDADVTFETKRGKNVANENAFASKNPSFFGALLCTCFP